MRKTCFMHMGSARPKGGPEGHVPHEEAAIALKKTPPFSRIIEIISM